ncbi:CHAT domain-containing tetratricopeptide repeat protein [uncultured Flavobacterium sp.]|uniref:CHAT domain-containing protein n=1 Tax=uncultured Flavobacterium sp. TaxID=165435 RepID=UPI0030EB5BBD|tara:strand:- start:5477 stop:8167 length:2691 start_codon:yes stop_codon:yes gene_type:complete
MKKLLYISFFLVSCFSFSQETEEIIPLFELLAEESSRYHSYGEIDLALESQNKAIDLYKKKYGVSNMGYYSMLYSLALIYLDIQDNLEAQKILLEIKKNIEKLDEQKHDLYISIMSSLAESYTVMGIYDKALKIYEDELAAENTKIFYTGKLALTYENIGQYNKALTLYIEALELTEERFGIDSYNYAIGLKKIANCYLKLGNNIKSKEFYEKFIEHLFISLEKEPNYVDSITYDLIETFYLIGQKNKALKLAIKFLQDEKNNSFYFRHYSELIIDIYVDIDQGEKALPFIVDLLKYYKEESIVYRSVYSDNVKKLANLYVRLGHYDKSLALYKEHNNFIQKKIKENFNFLTNQEKENFVKNSVSTDLKLFSNFNYLTNNVYEEAIPLAINNILTSKGLLLNASKNILTELDNLNNKDISSKVLKTRVKRAFIIKQQQLSILDRDLNFKQEQEQLEELEREIIKLYTDNFGEDINYVKNYKNTKLEENELAIEFDHFKVISNSKTDSIMYVAYLYKKDWQSPKVINLFEENQLKQYFTSYSNPNLLYKTRGSKGNSSISKSIVVDSIYKLIWKPIEEYANNSSKIYFSPDGLLHNIPFAALPNEDNKLIGELYDIEQVGNTADIRKNVKEPNLKDIVLIGGVDYEYTKLKDSIIQKSNTYNILQSEQLLGSNKNRSISINGFSYLPGTKKEISQINILLPNSKQLIGKDATETAFKALSGESPSVIHIATHGFFFPKLEKVGDENKTIQEKQTYIYAENPLLRSGLLLANANYAWKHGNNPFEEDDGILTALEISSLDLKNTDLVVLSACETGLGDIEGSEGVYGLQRAFKMAGVKSIIMSLWEVPDAETAEFMNQFYAKWKKSNNAKLAFKTTQKKMMKKYRKQPEKWAAFIFFE